MNIPLVITGICRGGTGYMAALCQSLQYDVQHEQLGQDGISSWCWAAPPGPVPYGRAVLPHNAEHFIQVVREPWAVISSIVTTYICNDPRTRDFMRQYVELPPEDAFPLEMATAMVCRWQRFITRQQPDLIVQVEGAAQLFPEYLARRGMRVPADFRLPPRNTNTRSQSLELATSNVAKLPAALLGELNGYCVQYGYRQYPH